MTALDRPKLALVVLLSATLACNAPSVQPAKTETPTPVPPTATLTPTPTIAPTPTIPAGWGQYHADSLKLTLSEPPGWEAGSTDPDSVDVHQTDGDGWAQVISVSGTGNNPFGLTYTPGMTGDAIMAALLAAARQDGTFADPKPVATRIGPLAWVSEGRNETRNEQTFIAAIGLADRALIVIGHGGQEPTDWPALSAFYVGITVSLGG